MEKSHTSTHLKMTIHFAVNLSNLILFNALIEMILSHIQMHYLNTCMGLI